MTDETKAAFERLEASMRDDSFKPRSPQPIITWGGAPDELEPSEIEWAESWGPTIPWSDGLGDEV